MKKSVLYTLIVVLVALFVVPLISGCVVVNYAGYGAVGGEGDMEDHEFEVGEYSKIRIEGFFEIHYYADVSNTVTLKTYSNLLENYEIEVKDSELRVRTTKGISFLNTGTAPVLTVSAPTLEKLSIAGASRFITHDTINADVFELIMSGAGECRVEVDVNRLTAAMSGAGSLRISGAAETAELDMSGAGEVNAFELETKDARVSLAGVGSVKISCSDNLRVNASGVGSVEYKGDPAIDLIQGGLASVRKIN